MQSAQKGGGRIRMWDKIACPKKSTIFIHVESDIGRPHGDKLERKTGPLGDVQRKRLLGSMLRDAKRFRRGE